jgi:hypothetical protein
MAIATGDRYARLLWITLVSGLLLFGSDIQMMAQITTAGVEGTITTREVRLSPVYQSEPRDFPPVSHEPLLAMTAGDSGF